MREIGKLPMGQYLGYLPLEEYPFNKFKKLHVIDPSVKGVEHDLDAYDALWGTIFHKRKDLFEVVHIYESLEDVIASIKTNKTQKKNMHG